MNTTIQSPDVQTKTETTVAPTAQLTALPQAVVTQMAQPRVRNAWSTLTQDESRSVYMALVSGREITSF